MDLELFGTVFASVFVAELGDKTQLATLLFAAKTPRGAWTVFAGAATALVVTSAIGVLLGSAVAANVDARILRWVAGIAFIAVGVWTLCSN
jgi:putative Ca2+/H+ antiporter (TMEM165/GDT1 family)